MCILLIGCGVYFKAAFKGTFPSICGVQSGKYGNLFFCSVSVYNRNLLLKPYFNLNSYGKRTFSVAAPEL